MGPVGAQPGRAGVGTQQTASLQLDSLRNWEDSWNLFCGVYNDLALFTHADTFGANSRDIFECEVNDPAFAGGHRIETEGLARGLHALGSNARSHAQFFKAQRAVTSTIEMNFLVIRGFEAQRAKRQVLDSFQDFGVAFEQSVLIAAVEVGSDFGIGGIAACGRLDSAHGHFQIPAASTDDFLQKLLQRRSRGLPV